MSKKTDKESTKKISNKKSSDRKNIAALQNLENEIESLKEKNIKLLAEFDNYQKRTLIEKERMNRYQGFNLIKDLLPVLDDIDRTINFNSEGNNKSVLEAVNMINSKMKAILSKYSIETFESANKDFDPNFHEALLESESKEIKKGKIIEEYEKGYLYHDKIIRHAKVVVSKGKGKK